MLQRNTNARKPMASLQGLRPWRGMSNGPDSANDPAIVEGQRPRPKPRESSAPLRLGMMAVSSRRVAGKLRLGDVAVSAPLAQEFAVPPALDDAAALHRLTEHDHQGMQEKRLPGGLPRSQTDNASVLRAGRSSTRVNESLPTIPARAPRLPYHRRRNHGNRRLIAANQAFFPPPLACFPPPLACWTAA